MVPAGGGARRAPSEDPVARSPGRGTSAGSTAKGTACASSNWRGPPRNFANISWRCVHTVLYFRPVAAAISHRVRPSASSTAISVCVGVSPSTASTRPGSTRARFTGSTISTSRHAPAAVVHLPTRHRHPERTRARPRRRVRQRSSPRRLGRPVSRQQRERGPTPRRARPPRQPDAARRARRVRALPPPVPTTASSWRSTAPCPGAAATSSRSSPPPPEEPRVVGDDRSPAGKRRVEPRELLVGGVAVVGDETVVSGSS